MPEMRDCEEDGESKRLQQDGESKCQRETIEEEGESKCQACDTNRVTQPYVGPVKSLEEAKKQGFERVKQFQVHRHWPRCRKGKAGEHGCFQMLPQAILKETRFDQVYLVVNPEDVNLNNLEELEVIPMDVIDEPVALTPMEGEICGPDERVICITLRRPQEEDGFVVEHHWAASCIVSGNTVKLGTAQNGKTAAFCQVKYTTKNNCEPIELAPLLVRSTSLRRSTDQWQVSQVHDKGSRNMCCRKS